MTIALGTAGLIFDEALHRYYLDGIEIPSVTKVIADNRLGGDFSRVPPADLTRARDLGRAVHSALHYSDEKTLDESTVADAVWPYLDAWIRFKLDHAVTVTQMERCLADGTLKFGGTLDREVLVGANRDSVLLDVKTGSLEGAQFQTAAYAHLAKCGPQTQRWAVALHPDRAIPYSIHPYRDLRDWRIFRAALELTHERARLGRHWRTA